MNNRGGPVWLHDKALDLDSLDLNSRFSYWLSALSMLLSLLLVTCFLM